MESGQSRPEVEVHVREIAMLGGMKANSDRGLIAILNLEIDVAHRRVKRARVCIHDLFVGRNDSGNRMRWISRTRESSVCSAISGKHHHVAHPFLVAGSSSAENEDRAMPSVSKKRMPGQTKTVPER